MCCLYQSQVGVSTVDCLQCKTTTNFWLIATTRFSVMTSVVYILSGFMIAFLVLNGNPLSRIWGIDSETESEGLWQQVATPVVGLVTLTCVVFVTIVNEKWLLSVPAFYLYMATVGHTCLWIRSVELDRLIDLLTGPVFVVVFLLGSWVERMIEKDGVESVLLGVVVTALPVLYVLGILPYLFRLFISLLIAIHYCTKKCVSCNCLPSSSALRDKIEFLQSKLVEATVETSLCRVNYFYITVMAASWGVYMVGVLNPSSEVPLRRPLGIRHGKGCLRIGEWFLNSIHLGK